MRSLAYRHDHPIYLLGGFEVLEDAVDGAPIHEEMILDALHHHPKTTSFETRVGYLSSPTATYISPQRSTTHGGKIREIPAGEDPRVLGYMFHTGTLEEFSSVRGFQRSMFNHSCLSRALLSVDDEIGSSGK